MKGIASFFIIYGRQATSNFRTELKVVSHIIVRYKFLSNFIVLVDYL